MAPPASSVRLPTDVVPQKYLIRYENIDFDACMFRGKVVILVDVCNPVSAIKLHALQLWLPNGHFKSDSGSDTYPLKGVEMDLVAQTAELKFGTVLPTGSGQLTLSFHGILNDQLAGFYRSYYEGPDGVRRAPLAVTQMEPTDARRAFPCWDEPALKATFELEVTTPVDLVCVSNTACVSTEVRAAAGPGGSGGGGRREKVWRFAATPVMSTYLVAVVVGEFDHVAKFTRTGVQVTVYTPPGKSAQGTFALDVACQALELYEELYGVPYPLTKSDLLAIPDFAAGAMENWGCVTYREARLLVEPGASSLDARKRIARTVCHELAHQWFGNLVTMEWWTHLWLNEGFARYMEFVAVASIFPGWDFWTDFDHEVFGTALRVDALRSSHPVEVEVHHPDEINAVFDIISYAKGASVIRMILEYIGKENFMKGIKLYLEKYAYGNTITKNLWNALEESSEMEIEHLAESWTSQTGYPLVKVEATGMNEEIEISVSQERFYEMGPMAEEAGDATAEKWQIPVRVAAQDDGPPRLFVLGEGPEGAAEAALGAHLTALARAGRWYKLNAAGHTGFFRTRYPPGHLSALLGPAFPAGGAAAPGAFPAALCGGGAGDRLGLLGDALALGRAGYQPVGEYLGAAFRLAGEPDLAVWEELATGMGQLLSLYSEEEFFSSFQTKVRELFAQVWDRCGFCPKEGEEHRFGTLRSKLIGIMAATGNEDVIETAKLMFDRYAQDPVGSPIEADIRSTIFNVAMKNGDGQTFEKMVGVFRRATLGEEQRAALAALGRAGTDALRARAWRLTVDDGSPVRLQDIFWPMLALGASQKGAAFIWNRFKEEYTTLFAKYGGSNMVWPHVVGAAVAGPYTDEHADEVEAFFAQPGVQLTSAEKKYRQSLEGLRAKALQVARDREALIDMFANKTTAA